MAVISTITRSSLESQERAAADVLQQRLASDTRIPYRVRRWAQAAALAAVRTMPVQWMPAAASSGDRLLAWAKVILAVMDRESFGGDLLTPKGPGGVGDPTPRKISRVEATLRPLTRMVGTDATSGEALVVPADNTGWGRGLMQLDWMSQAAARDGRWRDPTVNVQLGAELLAGLFQGYALAGVKVSENRSGVAYSDSPIGTLRASLAAYNAGPGNVAAAIKRGLDVDAYTHGGDYSSDVVRRASAWA